MTNTMKRHVSRDTAARRRGFTLIELLVVISIIAVLAALISPAILNARASARRVECTNSLKQVATAAISYAGANNGKLPALVRYNAQLPANPYRSWVSALLPYLDQAAVRRDYDAGNITAIPATAPHLQVLTCVVDENNRSQVGGLSYVANAGYMAPTAWNGTAVHDAFSVDWNGNGVSRIASGAADPGDARIAHATGVFWRTDTGDSFNMTLEFISAGDGQANTIMFTENIQGDDWQSPSSLTNTASVTINGITVPVNINNHVSGMMFVAGTTLPAHAGTAIGLKLGLNNTGTGNTNIGASQMNYNLTATQQEAPRPSSNHGDMVNFAFCGGNVRSINKEIHWKVYAQMVSPDGQRFGQVTISNSEL
jgi:prepilin-type N-terminal cleavage/methylation domain-containing protein/prepilin-type processing-associated H-X9-DG protein